MLNFESCIHNTVLHTYTSLNSNNFFIYFIMYTINNTHALKWLRKEPFKDYNSKLSTNNSLELEVVIQFRIGSSYTSCGSCTQTNMEPQLNYLPIGQNEHFTTNWTNKRGSKKNSLIWQFEMEHFQSLIILGLENEDFVI